MLSVIFFFNDTAPTGLSTLSLHDALPISGGGPPRPGPGPGRPASCPDVAGRARRAASTRRGTARSEEHTSELQSRPHLVCRLLLEKKKNNARVSRAGHILACSRALSHSTH